MRSGISILTIVCSVFPAFSQGAAPASPGGGITLNFVLMMVVMFAIIYFLMIRPEQKKQKSRQQMINNVKKGDKIVTIGGIYGTVGNVKDGVIMIKIAENTVVELRKGAISEVIADEKSVAEKEKEKEKKR